MPRGGLEAVMSDKKKQERRAALITRYGNEPDTLATINEILAAEKEINGTRRGQANTRIERRRERRLWLERRDDLISKLEARAQEIEKANDDDEVSQEPDPELTHALYSVRTSAPGFDGYTLGRLRRDVALLQAGWPEVLGEEVAKAQANLTRFHSDSWGYPEFWRAHDTGLVQAVERAAETTS